MKLLGLKRKLFFSIFILEIFSSSHKSVYPRRMWSFQSHSVHKHTSFELSKSTFLYTIVLRIKKKHILAWSKILIKTVFESVS